MARYKYSENSKEVTDIYFDTETHGEFMGMEQGGEMKKVTTARIKEKLLGEIAGRLDTLEGTGYTEGSLKTHEDRLDTLEGTGEGSVAKAIDDALEQIETDKTLTVSGMAADAKVTGDKVGELKSAINYYDVDYAPLYSDTVSGLKRTTIPLILGNKYLLVNNGSYAVSLQNRDSTGNTVLEGVTAQANSIAELDASYDGFIAIYSPSGSVSVVVHNMSNIYYQTMDINEKAKNAQFTYDTLGASEIAITAGKYIKTNTDTVDISTKVTNNQFGYAVVDCTEGDRFTVTGAGGSEPRLWCFIDSSGNRLKNASNSASGSNLVISAPKNANKLIINVILANPYRIIKGFKNVTDEIGYRIDANGLITLEDCSTIKGYIGLGGNYGYSSNDGTASYVMPVNGGDDFVITTTAGTSVYWAFLKTYPTLIIDGRRADMSDMDGFDVAYMSEAGGTFEYKVPADAHYIVVSNTINSTNHAPTSIVLNRYDFINKKHISTALKKASKLICTIIDDDAQNVESLEKLYTECEANNVKCTIATLTDKWENNTTLLNKLYELEEKGYHIVLHAYKQDGNNTWLDIDSRLGEYTANFVKGLRMVHQAGFANCDFWVTPAGIQTASSQALARQYGMKALIAGVHGLNLEDKTNYINGQATNNRLSHRENSRWRIVRANLRPVDDVDWTLQDLKDLALRGTEHSSWLVLCTHSYQWTDLDSHSERFAEFITYAKSLGYEFMTLGEAWTYKEPIYNVIASN